MSRVRKISRSVALKRVQRNYSAYVDLSEDHQSDREICMATLMAYDRPGFDEDTKILATVFQHIPYFARHKRAFLRFLRRGDEVSLEMYLNRFGNRIYKDRDFLLQAMKFDRYSYLFKRLPLELRSDLNLLVLAVEYTKNSRALYKAVPSFVLEENEFLMFRLVEGGITLYWHEILSVYWRNRDFVILWGVDDLELPLHLIPRKFFKDREICLSLCRNCGLEVSDVVKVIPKVSLADKEFVVECLMEHPRMFAYCNKNLQCDFDVVLAAAFGALRVHDFSSFTDELGESLVSFACAVHKKVAANDEFMTMLACWWKSRDVRRCPLSILDVDEETGRGFHTTIAEYLDFSFKDNRKDYSMRLKTVWDGFVMDYVERGTLPLAVVQLIQSHVLVKNVLRVIEDDRPVVLKTFPEELWNHRTFFRWAADNGIIHRAMTLKRMNFNMRMVITWMKKKKQRHTLKNGWKIWKLKTTEDDEEVDD
jgi:hypothetical protein